MSPERILVAAPMKCGSTYVAKLLGLYFGLEQQYPFHYWARREQNLDSMSMESLKKASFVLQLHSKPYLPLIRWLIENQVHVVFLWRNIADALVSLDEHIRTEDHRVPACYVHDRIKYSTLSSERRYRYLIQHAAPWYIQFYLMWKQTDALLPIAKGHYEELRSHPMRFHERLISALDGGVQQDRLAALLSRNLENTRFNQGISGRSGYLFSDANKRQLEQLLWEHPEGLSELVYELPWNRNQWHSGIFSHKESDIAVDLFVSNDLAHEPVGAISDIHRVRQSFQCRMAGLSMIELLGATYGKQIPAGVLHVQLERRGHVIHQSQLSLASVQDNSWIKIVFSPIMDSAGCEFDVVVTVTGVVEGYRFTLWSSDLNPHQRGTLRFAGEVHKGTLCMRIGCSVPHTAGDELATITT